jgi:hypothetical protein
MKISYIIHYYQALAFSPQKPDVRVRKRGDVCDGSRVNPEVVANSEPLASM